MSNIFNAYAFNITGKLTHKIKYLDGAKSLSLEVKTYEGGEPVLEQFEIFISNTGKPSIERL